MRLRIHHTHTHTYITYRLSQNCSGVLQATVEVNHGLRIIGYILIGSKFDLCPSLDPEGDPLCVLLLIDYYALRADEPSYLLALFERWEVRNIP